MTPFSKRRIASSQSLGKKLLAARKRKGVDLRTAEAETHIPMKHLESLEHGTYHHLPSPVYTRGFLTRYAMYLGLKPEIVLAAYDDEYSCYNQIRHVRVSKQTPQEGLLRPHVTDEWLGRSRPWFITPELLWGSSIAVLLVGLLGYIWAQVASFAAAPPLDVQTPGEVAVSVEQVNVIGTTDPSASLTINEQPVAVDATGHFNQPVRLIDGVNTLEISATNKANKETTKTIQLLADIPQQ
ncbi:helix-turn-helix domain-containing protein [Candidatus Berkelbacteria bacterium]|nr:helix-turn-helix domain-containing protein [Candidatus Berkelbacteria bacterium]